MSFSFRWPRFSDKFHAETMDMLTTALNKGNKPPIIEDRIEVVKLEMGTQPPELEIRDIGDLTTDQFRGIFKLSYSGDAHIELRTKVQANPLHHSKPGMDLLGGSRRILAAHQPLIVPMNLRLSNFKLNAYVVLVVSKTKGITLVFKTDPLQNVDVSSTFDSIAVIQKYIQKEIEGQLREMFREDLPAIIHKLSQRWIPGNSKIETPYADGQRPLSTKDSRRLETMSAPGGGGSQYQMRIPAYRFPTVGIRPGLVPRPSSVAVAGYGRGRPISRMSSPVFLPPSRASSTVAHSVVSTTPPSPPDSDSNESTFPELENYDPYYGMRPEGLPSKSAYSGLGRLCSPTRGLADLAEESADGHFEDEIDGTERSFDMLGWNNTHYDGSVIDSAIDEDSPFDYRIPSLAGESMAMTRPRVYHSQSFAPHTMMRLTSPLSTPSLGLGGPRTMLPSRGGSGYFAPVHPSQSPLRQQWVDVDQMELGASARTYNPHKANSSAPGPSRPRAIRAAQSGRSLYSMQTDGYLPTDISHEFASAAPTTHHPSPESSFRSYSSSGAVTRTLSTPPSSEPQPQDPDDDDSTFTGGPRDPFQRRRKGSISHSAVHPFDDDSLLDPTANINHELEASPSAIHPLRPGSNSAAHLSTLSYSNHTLSPFTRSLEHFTVRSGIQARHRLAVGAGQVNAAAAEPRAPVKARRKRTFYVGGKKKAPSRTESMEPIETPPPMSPPLSATPPSEFSEVDHYFAAESVSGIRRRPSFHV